MRHLRTVPGSVTLVFSLILLVSPAVGQTTTATEEVEDMAPEAPTLAPGDGPSAAPLAAPATASYVGMYLGIIPGA